MPAVASPSPHGGEGRGEGVRPRGQSPLTPTLSPLGRGSSHAQARPHYTSLVKTFAGVMAASLLLLAGAQAAELIRVGIAGFGGDAKLQQAMAANAVDIGLGSGPGLAFIAKGSPVKGIAAMAGPPLIFAMVVRADGSVKTVDDLKGRKVAISTLGSATNWLMNVVSRQHGWGFDGL